MARKSGLIGMDDPMVTTTLPFAAVSVVWFLAGEELAGVAAWAAFVAAAAYNRQGFQVFTLWVWAAYGTAVASFLCTLDAVLGAQPCADAAARSLLVYDLVVVALAAAFHARAVKAYVEGCEEAYRRDHINFQVMVGIAQAWAATYVLYCKSYVLTGC